MTKLATVEFAPVDAAEAYYTLLKDFTFESLSPRPMGAQEWYWQNHGPFDPEQPSGSARFPRDPQTKFWLDRSGRETVWSAERTNLSRVYRGLGEFACELTDRHTDMARRIAKMVAVATHDEATAHGLPDSTSTGDPEVAYNPRLLAADSPYTTLTTDEMRWGPLDDENSEHVLVQLRGSDYEPGIRGEIPEWVPGATGNDVVYAGPRQISSYEQLVEEAVGLVVVTR